MCDGRKTTPIDHQISPSSSQDPCPALAPRDSQHSSPQRSLPQRPAAVKHVSSAISGPAKKVSPPTRKIKQKRIF
ncbi:hypothetical protein BgiMline_032645 [Biomphalaria glabrata]|nr:hypothetical protein BgiMline_015658 [Biomphalaria glabrata]